MMHSTTTTGRLGPAHRALARSAGVHVWDGARGVWVRAGVRQLGMGMYPTDACYDPSRPSWLPYWWDTPSESGCRYQVYPDVTTLAPVPAPPGGQPMGAPQTIAQMTTPGLWTPSQAIDAGANATRQANLKFFTDLASQQAYGAPPPAPTNPFSSWLTWLLVAAGAALLLLRR
jgi:hypothetical protein